MKKVQILVIFILFSALFPVSFARAEGRFFVKSKSNFWSNTIGARNIFEKGFTADLSDLQLGILTLFRVDLEAVPVLHVLPDSLEQTEIKDQTGDQVISTPSPATTPKIKSIKNKRGVVRYLPSDQTPWGIETIYDNSDITKTNGGTNVKIALLDTGVNFSHPDLKNRVADCKDFTNVRFPVVDDQCEDKNGHGTHVAGVIAADAGQDGLGLYGIAPSAKIMAYRVCDATGSCYADDIVAGLRAAADNGANVINMSFGTDKEISFITDAISYVASKGVLMVAAAGNDGPYQASIDYPAAYESVIAVGALDKTLKVTEWSSRGINSTTTSYVVETKDIEFVAPGENIESTWKNGSYAILSGTSMASPHVAGLAARYWQFNSSNPAKDTRELLNDLAKDILPVGDDDDSGFGLPRVLIAPATP